MLAKSLYDPMERRRDADTEGDCLPVPVLYERSNATRIASHLPLRAFACRGCAYIQPTQIFTHPTAIKIVSTAVDSVAMSRSPEGARKGDALLRKWQKAAARNVVSEPRVPFGGSEAEVLHCSLLVLR